MSDRTGTELEVEVAELSDDHLAELVRNDSARRAAQKWSPVWVSLRRRDFSVRVGWTWRLNLSVTGRIHFGWKADGELPGVIVYAHLWRFEAWAGLGFGWQNEDGERSLISTGLNVASYGFARHVCRLLGHRPGEPLSRSGHVYCGRCDERLDVVEKDEPIAA